MKGEKLRAFRCNDLIWEELKEKASQTNQTMSSFIREALVEKIQRIKREEYVQGKEDWFIWRESKLQQIEQMFKNGNVDINELTKLVIYGTEK